MTRGLTLIELVIAMAVFALIAVMGLQSLSGSLIMRDRLSATAEQTNQMGQGVALLRNDLSAALPMLFFPPEKGAPLSALRSLRGSRGFSLSVGGQPALTLSSGGSDAMHKQRVTWQFDPDQQRLTRAVWPTLYPASAAQQGPQVPVLEGVTGVAFRSFWAGQGWTNGMRAPSGALQSGNSPALDDDSAGSTTPEIYSDTLPRAIEVTLETRDYGQIVLLEYFQ
ncbi:type II secretion system protein GspJ [Roseovarius sp. 2305UL8-3]|uniref:type II secretion system protein GspJ n=1 Tax=Roseovarius conchicola TaxID=3121636 RepID=UPI00352928CC